MVMSKAEELRARRHEWSRVTTQTPAGMQLARRNDALDIMDCLLDALEVAEARVAALEAENERLLQRLEDVENERDEAEDRLIARAEPHGTRLAAAEARVAALEARVEGLRELLAEREGAGE